MVDSICPPTWRFQATLSKQLRQAQVRIEVVLAEKERSEQALAAELTSAQRQYQTALQREQQLG